tara:strand:- start:386 stop:1138 length:753 start_codon:yes stop_codon:yes gene_type:complete
MNGGKDMSDNVLLNIDYSKRSIVHLNSDERHNKLVVFGDSFFEISKSLEFELSWTTRLADSLDRSLLNYAVSGTSLNYSIQMLFHYLETEYDKNDIIIFGVTNPVRTPNLLDDDHRGLHSNAWKFIDPSYGELTKEQYKYFQKDKKYWETMLTRGMYIDDVKNQLILLKNYLNNMKNHTLILHAFKDLLLDKDEFNLMKIIKLEEFKNFDKLNHLSDNNKKVLARQVQKYFMEIGQNKTNPFDIKSYSKG